MPRIAALLLVVFLLMGFGVSSAQNWYVEEAPEWDAMFDQHSGWSGADGIYSIPVDGNDHFGAHNTNQTLFVFSDTFIGEVDDQGNRLGGTTMINNTMAYLPPGIVDPDSIHFIYRQQGGNAASMFVPDTPNSQPGEWYWLGDGISLPDAVYILALRMRSDQELWFVRTGTAIIRIPAGSSPPFNNYQQYELPFHAPAEGDRGEISFTAGLMANTERAGAPNPDGFIYIYGLEEVPYDKYSLVARVPEEQFTDLDQWRFFDGQQWVADFTQAARLTNRVSSEMSVTPLPNNRYIMIFTVDTITRTIGFRIGLSPRGPWSITHPIYTSTVPDDFPDADAWCYNAKAHPSLSEPGELLISYNVNCLDFWDHFTYADIYRPRFIRLVYTGAEF